MLQLSDIMLLKYKVNRSYKQKESYKVVVIEALHLKEKQGKNQKYGDRDNLLYNFKLYKVKRTTELIETYPVGRYHKSVFK